jgi:Bifunctional DNA primase/polymerase, N-terminal
MTDNPVLRQALICADRGWPVFPCQPGKKIPATPHGYLDATTDPAQIRAWFARHPELNLAVATGAPGPDILDVDQRGDAGDGYPALARLEAVGLLDSSTGMACTPSGGLHLYFSGSDQRCGHLPACHLDFLSKGGYVLAPPSQINGVPYQYATGLARRGAPLDWPAVVRRLEPARQYPGAVPAPAPEKHTHQPPGQAAEPGKRPAHRPAADQRIETLTRWLAAQREGNRNSGLFWAANRALEADPAADLSPLAAAARQTGLEDPEITKTLSSARRITQSAPRLEPPDHQPEGAS